MGFDSILPFCLLLKKKREKRENMDQGVMWAQEQVGED